MATSLNKDCGPRGTRRAPAWHAGRVVPLFLLVALALLRVLYWGLPLFDPQAQAQTETVFGPKQFTRSAGPADLFTETFSVPSNVGPPFLLHIDNGLPDGTKSVSSASITLNAVEVVSPSELSERPATIDKQVTLQTGSNTLAVRLNSQSGTLLTITITGTDTLYPSLDTVSPNTAAPGQSLTVTLAASQISFQADVTEVSFGPNLSVGDGPEGAFGPVTVQTATTASAKLTISPTAALGPRTVTVRTATEEVRKPDAFTVLAPGPVARGGTTVSTIGGSGAPGFADGQGVLAQFNTPNGITRDGAGNLYLADTNNHRIRKITSDGTVSTLAGSGTPGLVNGFGTTAQFDSPEGVAAADATLYVADTHNHVIRKILPDGTVSTLAGTGIAGFLDGAGSTAQFDTPRSIALRPDDLLVVGDEGNNRVRLVDPVTGTVSTLAGSGTRGFLDGASAVAQFASLSGIAADVNNNVYVADTANQRIRKINAADAIVSTFAGTGAFGFVDGPASSAQFANPSGVAVDGRGSAYVADTFNSLIRRITPGGVVETVAGTGARGAEDGPGTTVTFRTPQALATGSSVFVADTGNHLIRRLEIGPTIAGLDPASGVQGNSFTLTVTGADLAGATALTFLQAGVADPEVTATGISVDVTGTTFTATVTIASTASLSSRVVTVTTPGGTSSSTASAANTFTVLGKLILTPDLLTVAEGATAPLTVSLFNPAPTGGIAVTLESAGPSIATVTSPVTIPEGATSTTATVSGVREGATNLTATAPGFAPSQGTVNVQSAGAAAITLTITEPTSGATITTDSVLVRGLVDAGGLEVGVSVNGLPSLLSGTQWAVDVPLVLGNNTISATATTVTGAQATTSITVQVTQSQEPQIVLKASPRSGLAPLTIRFEVESGLERPVVQYEFDRDGNGTIDLTSTTFENVQVTYTAPGLIAPTMRVTDDQGRTVTAKTVVHVLDKATTMAMFQSKWETLKAALAARDIPRATSEFAPGVRSRFEQVLRALDPALPTIAPTLGPVTITRVTDGLAEGVTQRLQGGKTYLYFIYWAPDVDGIWRIIEM